MRECRYQCVGNKGTVKGRGHRDLPKCRVQVYFSCAYCCICMVRLRRTGQKHETYMSCSCTGLGILPACSLRCPEGHKNICSYMFLYSSSHSLQVHILLDSPSMYLRCPRRTHDENMLIYMYISTNLTPKAVQEHAITASAASLSDFKRVFCYPGTRHQFQV